MMALWIKIPVLMLMLCVWQVVSGSKWGNMLVWDGGLIKVEVCRKNKKTCHAGTIQQFSLDKGELMSIGADGAIRVGCILSQVLSQ